MGLSVIGVMDFVPQILLFLDGLELAYWNCSVNRVVTSYFRKVTVLSQCTLLTADGVLYCIQYCTILYSVQHCSVFSTVLYYIMSIREVSYKNGTIVNIFLQVKILTPIFLP